MAKLNLLPGLGQDTASVVRPIGPDTLNRRTTTPPTLARSAPRQQTEAHSRLMAGSLRSGRSLPDLSHFQIPAMPQLICFDMSLTAGTREYHASAPIITPCVITQMQVWLGVFEHAYAFSAAIGNGPVASDDQYAACQQIFKVAPETQQWYNSVAGFDSIYKERTLVFPLNIPMSQGPKNRIIFCADAFGLGILNINATFHLQPL